MPGPQEKLSLTEWLVLCLVTEQPTHGFAVARLLGRDGSLGQVWRVPKPVVYRALQRLEQLALIEAAGGEPTSLGPVRSLVAITAAGRAAAAAWLARPVAHAGNADGPARLRRAVPACYQRRAAYRDGPRQAAPGAAHTGARIMAG